MDPICTFLFSLLVLGTTLTILRDVILVLMEGDMDSGLPWALKLCQSEQGGERASGAGSRWKTSWGPRLILA